MNKKWTLEEDNELQEELKANIDYNKISLNHKRTITGIKARIIGTIIYPMINDENKEEVIKESSIKYDIDEYLIERYLNKKENKLENKLDEINKKLDLLLLKFNS